MRLNKITIINQIIYVIFILMIFLTGSILKLVVGKYMFIGIIILTIILLFLNSLRIDLKIYMSVLSTSIIFLIINNGLYGGAIYESVIIIISIIFIIYIIYTIEKYTIDYLHIMANCIFYLSIGSLLGYLLVGYLGLNLPYLEVSGMGAHLYIQKIVDSDIFFVKRNAGIYWEPGVYQIFLNGSLIYFLNTKNTVKLKKVKLFFTVVNIILTFSPTGYAIMGVILFIKFMSAKIKGIYIYFFRYFLIFCLILFFLMSMYAIMIEKFSTESFFRRTIDVFTAVELIKEKPLLGWGINNVEIFQHYSSKYGIERNPSNGLLNLIYQTGICGFIIFNFGVFSYIKKSNVRYKYIIGITFVYMSLLNEPLSYTILFNFFLVFGYIIFIRRIKIK